MEREGKRIHFGARSCRQSAVDGEAALRQLTWALHLILAGENASVNRRRDQVISFCEDERLASPGSHPREDYPSLKPSERANQRAHCIFYTGENTHIERAKRSRQTGGKSESVHTWKGRRLRPDLSRRVVSALRVSCHLGLHFTFKKTGNHPSSLSPLPLVNKH